MEQIVYIVLGSLLALIGGFISQYPQNHLNQIKEDESLLFQADCLLLDYYPLIKGKDNHAPTDNNTLKLKAKEVTFRDDLSKIAIRICTKRYRGLAVRLTKFALDSTFRTEDNLTSLTHDVQMAINKPMIKKYESEMKDLLKLLKRRIGE
ncbi:MAG: hypothetical protein HY776_06760 [Actinobacteria bacterium]|nr:hypothetical protein [Actinomycetota bacterium]